jgi:hypothetical protein
VLSAGLKPDYTPTDRLFSVFFATLTFFLILDQMPIGVEELDLQQDFGTPARRSSGNAASVFRNVQKLNCTGALQFGAFGAHLLIAAERVENRSEN